MTDLEIINNSRYKRKPTFLDYVTLIFNNFQELNGDRYFANDKSMLGGIAKLNDISVLILGNEKGKSLEEKKIRNYGMSYPEGYRKALRLFKLAELFKLPIITFIDTPGAYPGISAEERGQNLAIATNLSNIVFLNTVMISVVIGEGCSGGALGIISCDQLFMLKNSYLSPIVPEGCQKILSKNIKLNMLINNMSITPNKLIKLNLIDEIINDYDINYNKNISKIAYNIKIKLIKSINTLTKINTNILLKRRHKRIINFGNIWKIN